MQSTILRCLVCVIAGFLVAAPVQTEEVETATTLIKAGRLIDTEGGRVLTSQMILVENDRIKAVGAEITAPKDATVIDLSAATVLPGLIDCHVHITSESGGNYLDNLFRRSFVDNAVLAHLYAKRFQAGFGTRSC